MTTRCLLGREDEIETADSKKKIQSKSGSLVRKLTHNREVYYVWFVIASLLHKYKYLPKKVAEQMKLEDYPLPDEWEYRDQVLDTCKDFLNNEGYRLFGQKVGKKVSAIVDEKYLKWDPQNELLIKIPLHNNKTFIHKLDEIAKLLKRVHKFTEDSKNYPQLEGCDWNLKKTRNTALYQTTVKKPKASYYWEIATFLKYYLELKKSPKDFSRELRGLKFLRTYFNEVFNMEYWNYDFKDKEYSDQNKFMTRFRSDVISVYKAVISRTFPK